MPSGMIINDYKAQDNNDGVLRINFNNHTEAIHNRSIQRRLLNPNYSAVYTMQYSDDDVIKGKLFPRYWPFVRGIY